MASLKDLKQRIESITSTRQITSAMKMVSAAKLHKAQQNIIQARPYADDIEKVLASLVTRNEQENNPFLRKIESEDVKSVAIIIVTADKGLCGAFNMNIIKKTNELIAKYQEKKIDLICVGKKGWKFFQKHNKELVKNKFLELFTKLEFHHSRDIMKLITKPFIEKKYDKVLIVYNEFISAIHQNVIVKQLLPLTGIEENKDADKFIASYLIEPGPTKLLNELIRKNIDVQIWRILLESYSSEQGARMTAMDAATDNADEMITDLTLDYHHKRQENITTEIIEVSSAVEAL